MICNNSSSQQQEPRLSPSSFKSSQRRKRRRATNVLCQLIVATTIGTILRIDAFTMTTPILLTNLHSHTVSHKAVAKSISSTLLAVTAIDIPSTRRSEKIVTSLSSKQQRFSNVSETPLPTTTLDKSLPQRRTSKVSKIQQHSRLSVQEQQELFRHVVEVRRIRKVELQLEQEYYCNDIDSKTQPVIYEKPSKSALIDTGVVSMLELSRRTGYGNNVHELETSLILGQQARDKLITTNMGLVHYCLRDILKYRTLRSITVEDLIQEGAIGLSRAVDKYNPPSLVYSEPSESENDDNRSKLTSSLSRAAVPSTTTSTHIGGAKFSTYAVYWIRAAMLRTISERDDIMRVPEHITTAIRKISNVAHARGYQWDRENSSYDNFENYHHDDEILTTTTAKALMTDTTVEEEIELAPSSSSSVYWFNRDRQNSQEEDMARMIADETGYSDQMVQNALMVRNRRNKYSSTVLSYESWMQQGKHYETDNSDFMQQQSSPLTWDEPIPNMEHMKQTLSRFLRPKEMEALSWRYGLNDNNDIKSSDAYRSNPLAKRDYLADAEMELFGSTTAPITKSKSTNDHLIVKGKWGEAMSFNDVGKQMQVSAEYGRRLCHAAIQKLRRAVDDGKLEPALLF